jgi:glycosyltransferase involved in cell wall biosynthesis
MKNFFIISNNSWNLFNFRFELIENISKENKVYLFCNRDQYSKSLLLNPNINIINSNFKKNYFNLLKDLFLFIKILYCVIYYKPDYILSYTLKPNFYSLLISLIVKVKVIINVTGLGSIYIKKNIMNNLIYKLNKFLLKKAFFIFFQNEDDRNELCNNDQYLLSISDVLPGSGINLKKFKYSVLSKENKNFIYIGRIIKDKGINELFYSIKKIKKIIKINFQIIGNLDKYNPSRLSKKSFDVWKSLNIFDYFPNHDDIQEFIKNSQCLILPSYREGCSKVIMEAMAIGRPVIATNVPGCSNLVKDGINGFLVAPKSSNQLYETILKFNNLTYEEKLKMGINGRKIIENKFDVQFVIDKYLSKIN